MTNTKRILSTITFLSLFVFVSSCTKEDDTTMAVLTEEEAVELIETSLQESTGGVPYTTEKYAEELVNEITLNDLCDSLYNDLFSLNYNGPIVQSAYAVSWTYEMACSSFNIPEAVSMSAHTEGSYTSPRVSSADTSSSVLQFSGLAPTITELTINGSHSRAGEQQLSVVNTRSVTSTFEANLVDVIIDKNTYRITEGTANVSLTGTSQSVSFSYEGSVTFNGNGQATLVLNGNTYEIDID